MYILIIFKILMKFIGGLSIWRRASALPVGSSFEPLTASARPQPRSRLKQYGSFRKIRGYLRVPLKGYYKPTIRVPLQGSKQGLGFRVSEKIGGTSFFWVLIIRILLFRVLYSGPLFSETPIYSKTIYSTLRVHVPK